MNDTNPLEMTFMPNTIEHLGVRMYSTLPPVLAELVANSYDADASEVHIHLIDGADKQIVISDNGHGMSYDDINQKFLRIGRNRRENNSQTSPGGRPVIGKKGLGKLAFFGISHRIDISTRNQNICNIFSLNWDDIIHSDGTYNPTITAYNEPCPDDDDGTIITLKDIQRVTNFDPEAIADGLSRLFILDDGFKVFIKHNDEPEFLISNDRKYESLNAEFTWKVPDDINTQSEYSKAGEIRGTLITTKTPIPPKTNMRGISLFSRGKLVNSPEYFSDSTSSHFFSYLTGTLSIDFIDDLDEDVIDTNRQSVNWDSPEMSNLRQHLRKVIRWVESEWRKKRAKSQTTEVEEKIGVNIEEWRSHLPKNIDDSLSPILASLSGNLEFPEKQQEAARSIEELYKLIPEYPYLHWRHLHQTLKDAVFDYYKTQDYYTAVFEGVKKYINEVRAKSASTLTDRELLENVYQLANPVLSVTAGFKKPDGNNFEADTVENITQGHRMLAIAIWQAFRSPIAHEVAADLRDSNLYTEQDCLDALGLLSHLFNRLEKATKVR